MLFSFRSFLICYIVILLPLSMLLEEQTLAYQKKEVLFLQNIDKSAWRKVKLGEVCEKVKTVDLKKMDGTFNYIDIGSINSETHSIQEYQTIAWKDASSRARQIVQNDDILFSTVRVNLERIAFLQSILNDAIASTGFCVLRAKKEIVVPSFLFSCVISDTFIEKLVLLQAGTAYPAVSDKIVLNQEINLPPLHFQDRFGKLVLEVESQIENSYTLEKDLQAMKKAVLQEVLGRQGGRQVKFSEVANCISQQVKPQNTTLEVYIGLEHLEPESLQITNFGKPSDVQGVKLKATKGDIIFGKRRAYQKKVAICEVDAIVSAHSMVLRANAKQIYPDFLPYFMQSDEFMERAVSISEGSLSPTIKWKVLAEQTFFIPTSFDRQVEYTALFRSFDVRMQEVRQVRTCLQALKRSLIQEVIG
jgi:restriction endonuclease S subunit